MSIGSGRPSREHRKEDQVGWEAWAKQLYVGCRHRVDTLDVVLEDQVCVSEERAEYQQPTLGSSGSELIGAPERGAQTDAARGAGAGLGVAVDKYCSGGGPRARRRLLGATVQQRPPPWPAARPRTARLGDDSEQPLAGAGQRRHVYVKRCASRPAPPLACRSRSAALARAQAALLLYRVLVIAGHDAGGELHGFRLRSA